jgi:hypothetical protein
MGEAPHTTLAICPLVTELPSLKGSTFYTDATGTTGTKRLR